MSESLNFLDPGVLAGLDNLELRARVVVEGFLSGLHKSPNKGFSVEFNDYRHYQRGDDMRHVDWKLYARGDRLYIKQYEDETNVRCVILLDTSASMAYASGGISKLNYGITLASALAYFIMRQRDAVGLITFDDRVRDFIPAKCRQPHLMRILRTLSRVESGHKTDVVKPLTDLAASLNRKSLVILISDLLDDEERVINTLQNLRGMGNDVITFQVMDDAELNFPFNEASEFIDMENKETYITSPAAIRRAYLANLQEFLSYCRKQCQGSGVDYCLLNTGQPLDQALSSYMTKRAKKFLMVFLTPLFLLGLAAVLLPLGIHLIRREKPPKLMFSTIRFLKKTSKKLILFQQLQQIFLLLLRCAVIVLLVMAFARPLVNQSVARLLSADPQSAVILLDMSMSMQYGSTFERARQEALDILGGMSPGDEAALVGFSDSAEVVRELTADLDSIRGAISGISQAGFGATRYLPNLRLADRMLEQSRFDNRAVYLVSDFQSVAMQSVDEGWKLSPGVAFTGIDVGVAESRNLVLTDVRAPRQLLENAAGQQLPVRVRSTGTLYLDRGEVSLGINGQVVDRAPVDLGDRSEEIITFNAVLEEEGANFGEVRVSGDDFEQDNSYYFTVDVLPRVRVLVVNGEASDNWFDDEGHWFGLAVSSGSGSPFQLASVQPAELSAALLAQNDVVVLLNVGGLAAAQAGAISDYVLSGGALLVAPGDRVDPALFNRQFEAIAPALLQSQDFNRDQYLVVADYDRRHPILRPLDSDWSARFQGHWRLEPVAGADVLMQFDNTEPALVERQAGQGRVILFASAMDLEWNNLPLQGLFLPFVHETLRHLVQPRAQQRTYQVGDAFSLDPDGRAGQVTARDANGNAVEFSGEGFVVEAAVPGFITADIDGEAVRYAVNILPEESNFARIPVADLYDAVINPGTNPIRSREVQTAQLVEELERPQRIWWWLLGLVMVLILAEALIANRTYR